MKYLQRTGGYTLLDHKRNKEILELHVTPLEEKLCTCRHNYFQHIHRMEDNRLPKTYKLWWRPGQPLRRYDSWDRNTPPCLNSWRNMMIMIMKYKNLTDKPFVGFPNVWVTLCSTGWRQLLNWLIYSSPFTEADGPKSFSQSPLLDTIKSPGPMSHFVKLISFYSKTS
jgi:hypothetical protein